MGSKKKSKMLRCMKGQIQILTRALDLYVRNMSGSGAHVFYGSSISCPTPQLGSLPRNVGVSSFNSSYSTTSDEYLRRTNPMSRQDMAAAARRSQLDRIGRIDEYKCCESEVVRPKGICSIATRRRKIASVDRDFTMNVKYKKIG